MIVLASAKSAAALCLQTNYLFGYADYYSIALLERETQRACEFAPADYVAEWDQAVAALRERTVTEAGAQKVEEIELRVKQVLADPRMDLYRDTPTKRCMFGVPRDAARAAIATRLLAFGKYNVHAVVRGESCDSPVTSADAVRHIPQIAAYYAILGVEDQCRNLSADFRKMFGDLLTMYAAKLEGMNEAEKRLLDDSSKWRLWLAASKHLDCEVYDRNEPLNALWELVRILKPSNAADLNRKIEVAQARNYLFRFYGNVGQWQSKSTLCPLPSMGRLLGKLGEGRDVERQVVAEVGREKATRLKQWRMPFEKIEADHCQFSDVKAFASMFEMLSSYGVTLPPQTSSEFKAKELHPGFLEFGELGYLEGCHALSDPEVASAADRLTQAATKSAVPETLMEQLQAFRTDTRNLSRHSCEAWAKEEFERTLNFTLK